MIIDGNDTLKVKGCGRLDQHAKHTWTRPRLSMIPRKIYICEGPPRVEGGNPIHQRAE